MINDITVAFNQHHIKPGYVPINDMVFKGSQYMSFRCELNENNEKVSSMQAHSYKPPHLSHVFEQVEKGSTSGSPSPPILQEILTVRYPIIYRGIYAIIIAYLTSV